MCRHLVTKGTAHGHWVQSSELAFKAAETPSSPGPLAQNSLLDEPKRVGIMHSFMFFFSNDLYIPPQKRPHIHESSEYLGFGSSNCKQWSLRKWFQDFRPIILLLTIPTSLLLPSRTSVLDSYYRGKWRPQEVLALTEVTQAKSQGSGCFPFLLPLLSAARLCLCFPRMALSVTHGHDNRATAATPNSQMLVAPLELSSEPRRRYLPPHNLTGF